MQHITIGTAGPNTLYVGRKSANGRPLDVGRYRHSELDCNQAIAMSVPGLIQEKACDPPGQRTGDPPVEPGSLVLVARFLNAALRMWDEDHIHAKSKVKAAAGMLRYCVSDAAADMPGAASPLERRCLVSWEVRRIKAFIDASLESKIGVRDCANKIDLSAAYFGQAFKATFGVTVSHYIRCRRIERAQQIMLLSNEPQSQIALACGFANQAHYSRVFRAEVGLSPNRWRRRHNAVPAGEQPSVSRQ